MIQTDIDELKALSNPTDDEDEIHIGDYGNVSLGAAQRAITFERLEDSQNDLEASRRIIGAFQNFRERFTIFFHNLIQRPDSGLQPEEMPDHISIEPDDQV